MTKFAHFISRLIDRFYYPFIRRIVPLETFRYAACGAINLAVTWVAYFVSYNFIFRKENLDLGFVVISPYIAAIGLALPFNLVGFYLNKYVAFKQSPLRGRTQIMRYGLSVGGALLLNYLLVKVFHEICHIYPTPSEMIASLIVTGYSYLMQKYFTFRGSVDI